MRLLTLSVVSALLLAAVDADAQATSEIAAMVVDGSSRTRHQALLELLPRPLPARYTQFHDLVPTGWFATLELRPGVFVGPAQPRHEARLTTKASLQLGRRTALVARAVGEAANGGNPNHSALIGSQRGVRGLPDTLYRSGWIAFTNVELRHAFEIATRWFLQPVVFTDAGCFQPLDRAGSFESVRCALAVGAGVRLLPTALVDTLVRLDGARLLTPTLSGEHGPWLLQLGINQYF